MTTPKAASNFICSQRPIVEHCGRQTGSARTARSVGRTRCLRGPRTCLPEPGPHPAPLPDPSLHQLPPSIMIPRTPTSQAAEAMTPPVSHRQVHFKLMPAHSLLLVCITWHMLMSVVSPFLPVRRFYTTKGDQQGVRTNLHVRHCCIAHLGVHWLSLDAQAHAEA